eukprot:2463361-Amphidinium_carterae.1
MAAIVAGLDVLDGLQRAMLAKDKQIVDLQSRLVERMERQLQQRKQLVLGCVERAIALRIACAERRSLLQW